ncbi:Sut1p KNAG_0E03440 [Huiozyma naganishii CBS 8797]|uniref:Zn(2)-C6 fungal-type domain-containing protein n=1 Tax=Huiozyma naganishii (strain ATCC MYA-139 / BCRC 22969 / CBS 8797 / KCTC 17520 / NBRC 10181 / NCYC 3082 / Yp74L-3) TaxID=1071383 RepID=J7S7Z9_HUIN7|nr:hypothetical protein KNAG_0E03440 [Kazachstania naganishii CBS 8797]CCK70601.1 hypothetical protein KNAG_0E03440 [Kazachstania naganishii CBS 8797]
MPFSIPVSNNNNDTLPPLLLPDLVHVQPVSLSNATDPLLNSWSNRLGAGSKSNAASVKGLMNSPSPPLKQSDLENLAHVATKNLRNSPVLEQLNNSVVPLKGISRAQKPHYMNPVGIASITPPPSEPPSNSITPLVVRAIVTQDFDDGNTRKKPGKKRFSFSPKKVAKIKKQEPKPLKTSKRQRNGPSCDQCRLKKIKCDAIIEVIAQNESILTLCNDKLHHVLTKQEFTDALPALQKLSIHASTWHDIKKNDCHLVKHLDKLIIFKSCTSCYKKQGRHETNYAVTTPDIECCIFSKGFTRSDINIFSKISSLSSNKTQIDEMTVTDYHNTGF